MNSPEYWDRRFAVDWTSCGGPGQTAAFMDLLVDLLPEPVRQAIADDRLEIVDWGCAEGDGIPILERAFPASKVVGIDVAANAIERARERFPDSTFECLDLTTDDRPTDVIVCSNVLEHFSDPLPVLRRLARTASRYVIVLVPFLEDPLIDEHEVSFDHESFPLRLDGKLLSHARSVDLRWRPGSPWPGLQMLAIYGDAETTSTLADLNQFGPLLGRRVRRQQRAERVMKPVYRLARVDRWLLGRGR